MRISEKERFWRSIRIVDSGCWEWTKSKPGGYGQFYLSPEFFKARARSIKAHRYAYLTCVGPIPEGKELDHLCRNTKCVNPLHLEPVPHRTNILRGSNSFAQKAKKTHCSHGHELTKENTLIRFRRGGAFPQRECKVCARIHSRDKMRRRRANKKGSYASPV